MDLVVQEITEAGGTAAGWTLGGGDLDRIHTVVDEIGTTLGDIGVVVNNAGIAVGGTLDMSDDEYEPGWAKALDVLLTSHQRIIRAALPQMRRAGDGRIINIASTEGLGATKNAGPYTAVKHGVVGLTRSMAPTSDRRELRPTASVPDRS